MKEKAEDSVLIVPPEVLQIREKFKEKLERFKQSRKEKRKTPSPKARVTHKHTLSVPKFISYLNKVPSEQIFAYLPCKDCVLPFANEEILREHIKNNHGE